MLWDPQFQFPNELRDFMKLCMNMMPLEDTPNAMLHHFVQQHGHHMN